MRRARKPLDPWQCDALDLLCSVRPDGKWACYEYAEIVARQNGKGGILEGRALGGFFLFEEELIMWSAHEYKTAMEAFRRLRTLMLTLGEAVSDVLIEVDGILVKVSNTNGEESFERLDTEQRIKFVARSKGSGRGFSGDVVIIDETFAYTADQHSALLPTMNARPNPQIIYTSSPPLDPNTGEVLFSLQERALDGGDDSLGYRDWGAEGDLDHLEKIDLDDRELWRATNPAYGGRITEETLRRNRRSMATNGGRRFAREILGVWPKQNLGGGAIDLATWVKLEDPDSKRVGEVAVGVDIAPNRDYAAIGLYGMRLDPDRPGEVDTDDQGRPLGHLQLVKYEPGTHWIVGALVEIRDVLGPVAIGMGRGTAKSLEVELAAAGFHLPTDPEQPERGDLAVTSALDMAAACGQIIDASRQRTDRHVPAQALDAAVTGARTRQVGDTIAWSHKSDTDIAPLVSVTVARWAYRSRIEAVTNPKESPAPWIAMD